MVFVTTMDDDADNPLPFISLAIAVANVRRLLVQKQQNPDGERQWPGAEHGDSPEESDRIIGR